ncbi:hypothetical protein VTI74DRAFT_10821 [Chaetomium olivicolor]
MERRGVAIGIGATCRGVWHTAKATLLYSPSNALLPFVALGIAAGELGWSPAAVFILNFLAMFPLASILTFSTEQLAAKVGAVMGGLINATFGNAVEMIVGISALREKEVGIVQSSMIGSMLSSILLILGSCFFAVGLRDTLVTINRDIGAILTSLMIISCASLVVPAALYATDSADFPIDEPSERILALSRFASTVLLLLYVVYIIFQTWTHAHLFSDACEDENDADQLSTFASAVVLVIATLGISVTSDYLVDSVDGLVETLGISRGFIGLIVVPIVGNASCFVATVQWALSGKIQLAVSVIVGSTLQISLFVTPFLVILGWIIGSPMSLQFDTFETVVLTMSVLVVHCLVRDGSTNYFEGLLLIATYLVIGIAFFVHPDAAR